MRAFNEAASSSRLRSRGYEPVNDSQPLAKKKKKDSRKSLSVGGKEAARKEKMAEKSCFVHEERSVR